MYVDKKNAEISSNFLYNIDSGLKYFKNTAFAKEYKSYLYTSISLK